MIKCDIIQNVKNNYLRHIIMLDDIKYSSVIASAL